MVPEVTTQSSGLLSAQRPPVYLQAAAGNSFAAARGACDCTTGGTASRVSNALSLQREFTEYFEEGAGKNSTMAAKTKLRGAGCAERAAFTPSANKGFVWKEEDLEWLGMKFFQSGKS